MRLFEVYPLFNVEPVEADGCLVYDRQHTAYLDFYGGHAVISIGHGHPHYVERVTEQLGKLGFYSNSVPITIQKDLAHKLGEVCGYYNWNLFLCNSGAEAIENALKVASAYNQRKKIVAFDGAFHGRTSLAVAATHNPDILFPVNEGAEVVRFAFEDFEGVEAELKKGDISSVLIEGIQGVAGIIEPSADFLRHLRTLCDETDTILILDEVQSGFGRTGRFFAHQHAFIQPDIITIAKGMGNGFPVGGIITHPKFEAKHGMLGTTFGGNHLACAAALAVLEVIENEKLIKNAANVGNYLVEALKKIDEVKEVRGRGLMIGAEFGFPVADLRKRLLYEQHVFTGSSSNKNIIRLLPPLNITYKEADQFIDSLKEALK
ncbi:MAG: aminotransferase class III-fold pyridoxal phosphate-dependent enzyme [Balneolaceae bacterium]|nr:aminotransferase class III-fold pyridoxal phosphate-dependent enzyme [Balneolaceae bacterium]MBO6545242.1 aminotransferase class III-fold pyridoxal phosphate-dependent enzyme [Balneolaceae bacterium]MBO6646638.1 aminotransferase class III-fold pyridoxal phosphate-dependent enzyme [Balneolaceae bacterium]